MIEAKNKDIRKKDTLVELQLSYVNPLAITNEFFRIFNIKHSYELS